MTQGLSSASQSTISIGAIARGVDLSRWNSVTDWSAVAGSDVQFAILATRTSKGEDATFRSNAVGASKVGIRIGAYVYSMATSVAEAKEEAAFVLNLIKDYPISFPVAFDAEDSGTLGTLSKSGVSEVINAFCSEIKAAGYTPVVYANEDWIANKIDMSKIGWDVWVARYNTDYTYKKATIWQNSSNGSVSGISGRVDTDYLYKDYTRSINGTLWRTINGVKYYFVNHVMQKNTWFNDGKGWYYADENGLRVTGWIFHKNDYYYMDSDGKMVTGWQKSGNSWYYLDDSGAMARGWRNVGGKWYYLADSGAMETGLVTVKGTRYYLKADGAMAEGWVNIGGSWYYFDPGSGEMAKGWRNDGGKWYYMDKDGVMQSGWTTIGENTYYLENSGAMATGFRSIGGSEYYFSGSGRRVTGWRQIDGSWYWFDKEGRMQAGWQKIQNFWYYLGTDGKMQTGWQEIGGILYHLEDSGAMSTGTVLDRDGVSYYADENGACSVYTAPEESAAGTQG